MIRETAGRIRPADKDIMEKARQRQESLAKPPGSLGGLEEISIRVAGMTGRVINRIERGCVAVFCADNGVAAEGVASAPQSVTMAQTVNFTRRLTGVGALAESFGSELLIVDMGVKDPIPAELYCSEPLEDTHKIVNRRIRLAKGETGNIATGPAMTREEAEASLAAGVEMADAIRDAGYDIMGIGEMGIGNTTTSAAVLSAVTGLTSEETVGRGGGVNDEGFRRKKEIVDFAAAEYVNRGGILKSSEDPAEDMVEALARMGGFDLCAMTGAYLGAAANRMPVVIDGYISVVAALAARVINPDAADYMIASHKSWEKGYSRAVEILGLKPFLALDMRLGEGSGCPVAFRIIRGACDVMANMATFSEAAINDEYLEEIRAKDSYRR
ncbi:MAG: nicotinate-nucleotide--dimethylbenzimidazole phosphoribosyltransferase [Clostridiales bacterium]|nr:nicotinate-nucleotide--dimethylbenzimidazole phosphoribosyltransferase [Clostridiales bacterium]MDD7035866.1 nicotinate-nucleotide--dimethylbenzimidazole phosphoribosyltransferase [Bacillota bacterium]MDY2920106.1 nicotinate-nucleotide--dimethylbenzimidazole phosphoribosyltransferase [Lentihominibacter sp.]